MPSPLHRCSLAATLAAPTTQGGEMTRPARPALSFGIGAAVGTAGGLKGLSGAEFRLPAPVGGGPRCVSSVLGAILGALALGLVPAQVLKVGLGVILILSAWGVFRHLPKPAPAGTR